MIEWIVDIQNELTRLREENEELNRRLKEKVNLQLVFLAQSYEEEIESLEGLLRRVVAGEDVVQEIKERLEE